MSQQQRTSSAVIVPASAGSGKTFRIAQEYIYDVLRNRFREDGTPYFDDKFYKRILAVTFTNKATEEMKSRILKEIHILASGEKSDHLDKLMEKTSLSEEELRRRALIVRSNILHDYSHFTVLTNDTFFQRILRAFVRELNIDMNFTTEIDTAPMLAKSVDTLIANIAKDSSLHDWISDIAEDLMNQGKRWDFRKVITSLTDELFNESARDIIAQCKSKKELNEIIKSLKTKLDKAKNKLQERYTDLQCEAKRVIDDYQLDKAVDGKKLNIFKADSDPLFKFSDTVIKHITLEPKKWFNNNQETEHRVEGVVKLQKILRRAYKSYTPVNNLENTLKVVQRNYRSFALLKDLQDLISLES
ncbi:MAG: UvrD-helicase domain-containing protein, partial [Alistipes sp.]|nr:UvrD-helicase domain-containing protein [Alistipes sp.]